MRAEAIGNATMYLGDCLEVMARLPEGGVDAVPLHLTNNNGRL